MRTDINSERRLIKYSPLKHGPHDSLYLIVETGRTGGELKIQWYISNTEYNYYFTSNLLASGIILMLVFYYFITNAVNSLIYLWQARAGRRASVNGRPKCLVNISVDVSGSERSRGRGGRKGRRGDSVKGNPVIGFKN